jgi:two-component system LytT family response regulator
MAETQAAMAETQAAMAETHTGVRSSRWVGGRRLVFDPANALQFVGLSAAALLFGRVALVASVPNSDLPGYVRSDIDLYLCDEYALRAFEAGALDYLLKPFDDARFKRALDRAKDKIAHYYPQHAHAAERLVVKSRGEVLFLNVADIDWIEAVGYYACLHVGSDTHIMRRTLLELERDLGESTFMRIHRSIIVNLNRIHRLELQNGGDYEVVLKSQVWLRLSRRFHKPLQERMDTLSDRD